GDDAIRARGDELHVAFDGGRVCKPAVAAEREPEVGVWRGNLRKTRRGEQLKERQRNGKTHAVSLRQRPATMPSGTPVPYASYAAVTTVLMPPRTEKSPI